MTDREPMAHRVYPQDPPEHPDDARRDLTIVAGAIGILVVIAGVAQWLNPWVVR